MKRKLKLLAIAFCLAAGCNNGNAASDMSSSDNMAGGGPLGTTELLAGRPGGFGNADGVGMAARFHNAAGVGWDGLGNLYVADAFPGNTIRKISTATGVVSTLASSLSGDTPAKVVSDGAGNLYFTGQQSVGKIVVATGMLTTLAGGSGIGSADGTGTAAQFFSPFGLTWDGAGNLYVADEGNRTIRKIVVATGVVTTIAGMAGMVGNSDGTRAAARFADPVGITWDGAGNLYVSDSSNMTIRKIVAATGDVTTLAGTALLKGSNDGTGATARFSFPGGVAWDGAGNLYVADTGNMTIRKIVAATGEVTTIAGTALMSGNNDGIGAAAFFNGPSDLAWDGNGTLYIADGVTVRKLVTATGAVTTLAGVAPNGGSTDGTSTAARFLNPNGIVADGAGNVYIADYGNNTIRKLLLAAGTVTTLAGNGVMGRGSADGTGAAARFNGPTDIATDGAGNLYVADSGNCTIRKIVAATGVVTTLAGTAPMAGSSDGTGAAARFNSPSGIDADGAGNLYVADTINGTIRKIVATTGVVTTIAGRADMRGGDDGTGAGALFRQPTDVVSDRAGNLYVTDALAATIRQIAIPSGDVTTLAGTDRSRGSTDGMGATARFSFPQNLTIDGAGNLYVADNQANGTVRKIVLATRTVTTVVGVAGQMGVLLGPLPGGLNQPRGLAMIPNQGLVISDGGENVVLIACGL